MGKLLNTIKYASAKTKAVLLMIIVLVIVGLTFLIMGIVNYSLLQLAVGVGASIIGLVVLLMSHFTEEDIDSEDEEDDEDDDAVKMDKDKKDRDGSKDDRKSSDKRALKRKNERGRKLNDENESEAESFGEDFGQDSASSESGTFSIQLDAKNSLGYKRDSVNDSQNATRELDRMTGQRIAKRERSNQNSVKEEEKEDAVSQYTYSLVKKTLKRFKVKRDHIPIIIDECRSFDTERTPAYCWSKKDTVYFLLLEGNARVVSIPKSQFLNVSYRQGVSETDLQKYEKIKNEMEVYEEFADVMPMYTSSTDRMGRNSYSKNQYILGRDIAVTPKSLRALRSKFEFNMELFDSLNVKGDYGKSFKMAYEARLLWTDNVISQQEYQRRIRNILQAMVDDRELIRYDFLDEVEQMVRNRLITTEYADYYMQMREKRDAVTTRRK